MAELGDGDVDARLRSVIAARDGFGEVGEPAPYERAIGYQPSFRPPMCRAKKPPSPATSCSAAATDAAEARAPRTVLSSFRLSGHTLRRPYAVAVA
ncbi:hypothetical protein [Streptomyces sp. OP7]|uniref:hypothetical protein n=1 Tax=Streptomyces sp. OP7 TaxID=3142462 RepID=UPI0032E8E1A3